MGEGRREAAPGDDRGIGPDPIWIGGGRGRVGARVGEWSRVCRGGVDKGRVGVGRPAGPGVAQLGQVQWGGFCFFCFLFCFAFSFIYFLSPFNPF